MFERRRILLQAESGSGKTGGFLWPIMSRLNEDPSAKIGILVPNRELGAQVYHEARTLLEDESATDRIQFMRKTGTDGEGIAQLAAILRRRPGLVVATPKWTRDVMRFYDRLASTSPRDVEIKLSQPSDTPAIRSYRKNLHKMVLERADAAKRLGDPGPFDFDTLVVDEADSILKPLPRYATRSDKNKRMLHPNAGETIVKHVVEATPDAHLAFFSATANAPLRGLSQINGWDIEYEKAGAHRRSLPAPIKHYYAPVEDMDKVAVAAQLLREADQPLSLVIESKKSSPGKLATRLKSYGIKAVPLHTALNSGDLAREKLDKRIASGDVRALVASEAVCHGLDFPQLSHVILMQPPKYSNEYLHYAGRTGRLGQQQDQSVAITLCGPGEVRYLGKFAQAFDVEFEVHPSLTYPDMAGTVSGRFKSNYVYVEPKQAPEKNSSKAS